MSEYNWRKEREKFRPETFKAESESTGRAQVITAEKHFPAKVVYILTGVILAAVIVAGIFIFNKGDSSKKLANAAEKYKTAVGLVTVTVEVKNGKKKTDPVGTAWAFSENRFATNGHVANGLSTTMKNMIIAEASKILTAEAKKAGCKSLDDFLKKQGDKAEEIVNAAMLKVISQISNVRADIIINSTKKKSYNISYVQVHKDYGVVGSKFNPDLAVFTIDGKHDNYFKLADKNTLENLKSGLPVAFLGFPVERLLEDNVHLDNPIASMQCGNIVAVSDFEMKDAGAAGNFLLRHNLPATGGASGSPIFNQNGEVVAALFGGNVIGQVSVNGDIVRAPSAAQINFGVRIDLISGMGKSVPIKEVLKF